MAPKFGTSGLRGLVSELTPDLVSDYIRAFVTACDTGTALYLGRDLRESSPEILEVIGRAARDFGLRTVDCGAVPTPALALAAQSAGAGAVMVTGSHIPADRNGLKFYTPEGEITKAHEGAILSRLGLPPRGLSGQSDSDASVADRFKARYLAAFSPESLAGARIGVYAHSSVARDMLVELLTDLGAQVTELGRAAHFVPVDTEAVDAVTREQLRAWAQGGAFDAIVSSDGDADRPLITDAAGEVVAGDVIGQITAQYLGADEVVTPVSSNSGVELSGKFARVLRTKIGSPYVISALETRNGRNVVGYEANGGFLLGFDAKTAFGRLPRLMTRDCILPILASLVAARQGAGVDLAARVAAEPPCYTASDRIEGMEADITAPFIARLRGNAVARADLLRDLGLGNEVAVDLTDGVRMTADSGFVLHLRPSGNAPELRIYFEASDPQTLGARIAQVKAELKRRLQAGD